MIPIILKNTPMIVLGINSIKSNTDFIPLEAPIVLVAIPDITPVFVAETIQFCYYDTYTRVSI